MRKLDNDMVLRADSPAIDLTTWLMFQSGSEFSAELLDLIARRVNDVVKAELKDEPPHLSFDEDNKDPTTMLLMLPLGENDGSPCMFNCTLESVVDYTIDGNVAGNSDKIEDEEGVKLVHNIAARLRQLADKLEAACK